MEKAGRLIYQGFLIAWDGFWVVWLSDLLWVAFCLPLVTAPLAFAGLYECAHALAEGKSTTWRTFFSGIKRHWGASYRWSAFNMLVVLILAFYFWFFSPQKGSLAGLTSSLIGGLPLALIALWWLFNQYTFPFMLVQKKPSYRNALRNSLVMFLKWPGVTLSFTFFNFALIVMSLWLRFPWLVFGASLPALMACLCVKHSVEQTLGAGPLSANL
jgi:hypothetical protein